MLHGGQQDGQGLFLDRAGQREVFGVLAAEQQVERAVRVIFHVLEALFAGAQESAEQFGVVFDGVIVGDKDKLVVSGHAVVGHFEVIDLKTLFF